MMDKRFLESFLRLNNVAASASTEEIKGVLTQAHWTPREIEEALLVHGGDDTAAIAYAHKRHEQVFRPDMDWSSSKLSSLLGVDVVIDPKSFRMPTLVKERLKYTSKKVFVGFCIVAVSVAVAVGLGIGLMYLFEIGPFYTHTGDII